MKIKIDEIFHLILIQQEISLFSCLFSSDSIFEIILQRKVATSDNGLLTFERFCAGLKICLLRNQKVSN